MPRRAHAQLSAASKRSRPATERSLALLDALANAGRPVSLKELAADLEIPQTTAFRLCQLLENRRYIAREAGGRRYTIGVKLLRLGLSVVRASGPTTARHQILSELVGEIGETCNLTAVVGTNVVYLDRVEAQWPLRVILETGSRVPLHCTASGKLFLAAMASETRDKLLAFLPLAPFTDKTIVDKRILRREILRIRKRGFSTDDEEFLLGLACVAVPLLDRNGKTIAAIGCHAPKVRLSLRQLVGKIDLLQVAARRLERTFDGD
jgi:DNA-binding IclR family transcriptional regulator